MSLKERFTEADLNDLVKRTEAALDGITEGPWLARFKPDNWPEHMSFKPFVEAPEPEGRNWGYGIDVAAEDDNGYPTRDRDVAFIADSRQLVPELLAALKVLLQNRGPKP